MLALGVRSDEGIFRGIYPDSLIYLFILITVPQYLTEILVEFSVTGVDKKDGKQSHEKLPKSLK